MPGRPLRFLLLVLGSWTGVRTMLLWPRADSPRDLIRQILIGRPAAAAVPVAPVTAATAVWRPRDGGSARSPRHPPSMPTPLAPRPVPDPERIRLALLGFVSFGPPPDTASAAGDAAPPWPAFAYPLAAVPAMPSRWSGSGWLLARGGGAPVPLGGQIGGAQAGMRLAWAIDPARRLAAVARLASPLAGRGREASIGLEWQPIRAPLRVVAERRFALDGGRGGFGAGVVGGAGPLPLPLDFRLEGYGQAGAIRRVATEPYADGALRLSHAVASAGTLRVELGVGAWGAAQRDAQRLDIGPSIGVAIPIAERTLRLSIDWRQRIAGSARPGSGAALTLGTDF